MWLWVSVSYYPLLSWLQPDPGLFADPTDSNLRFVVAHSYLAPVPLSAQRCCTICTARLCGRRGIQGLFRWQAHCLRVDDGKPLEGGNLIYRRAQHVLSLMNCILPLSHTCMEPSIGLLCTLATVTKACFPGFLSMTRDTARAFQFFNIFALFTSKSSTLTVSCILQCADERRKDSGGRASSPACLAEAQRNNGFAGGAVRGLGVGETGLLQRCVVPVAGSTGRDIICARLPNELSPQNMNLELIGQVMPNPAV